MAFCNNCGMEITEDTVFCPKCGVPVANQPVQNNNGESAQSQNFQQPQQPQQQYYQQQQPQQQYYQPQQTQQQYYQPQQPQQQYYQPQQPYQQQGYMQQGLNIDTTGMLIWSIINIFFCWPLSVYSIVTLNKVNKSATRGEGESLLNTVKTVNAVATGLGILCLIIALSI